MPIPTWSVGQVLAASDVDQWFVPLAVVKPSSQSVTSSTTPVNDTALLLAMAANATYVLDADFPLAGAAIGTGDFKMQFTVPSGATYRITVAGFSLSGGGVQGYGAISQDQTSGTWTAGINAGAGSPCWVKGLVTTGSTSGNLQLQWAQNTSNATATQVLQGSWMMLRRIG